MAVVMTLCQDENVYTVIVMMIMIILVCSSNLVKNLSVNWLLRYGTLPCLLCF